MCSRNVQAKRPVPYNLCQVMTVYVSYVQSASCKPKWSLASHMTRHCPSANTAQPPHATETADAHLSTQEENPYILHN